MNKRFLVVSTIAIFVLAIMLPFAYGKMGEFSSADMAGNVMKVTPAASVDIKDPGAVLGKLQIGGRCAAITGVRIGNIVVTKKTKIEKKTAKTLDIIKFGDIKKGHMIEIWFGSPPTASFEIEGEAKSVVIHERPDEIGNIMANLRNLFKFGGD